MNIISQTIFTKIFEYLLTNWKVEIMIALIVGFSVYFVMRYRIRYAISYYENLLLKYNKRLDYITKDLNDLKNIAKQINEEKEKTLLVETIEKIIDEKINNK